MSPYLSMAAFALASSISPGPVNIVALSSGARFGFRVSLVHVTSATVGFTILLVLIGIGLRELLALMPWLATGVLWAGVAFLLYMAVRLALDDGRLSADEAARKPSLWHGGLMQWLNPKAWLACIAGMGAFAASGEARLIWQFSLIFFGVCYLSIACWAWAGAFLGRYLKTPTAIRSLNRTLAAMLVGCAGYLVLG